MFYSELLTNIANGSTPFEEWPAGHIADCKRLVEMHSDLQKAYRGKWTVEVALQSEPFDDFKFSTDDGIEADFYPVDNVFTLEVYIRDYVTITHGISAVACFNGTRSWLDDYHQSVAATVDNLRARR